jgi:hypothetical protein
VVKFDRGNVLPGKKVIVQTSLGAIFPVLLLYHVILFPEIHLTDRLMNSRFHVSPILSAVAIQKIKCLINAKVMG